MERDSVAADDHELGSRVGELDEQIAEVGRELSHRSRRSNTIGTGREHAAAIARPDSVQATALSSAVSATAAAPLTGVRSTSSPSRDLRMTMRGALSCARAALAAASSRWMLIAAAYRADHARARAHPLADLRTADAVRGASGRLAARGALAQLEAITVGDRVAVVYSRHDLGGAWARDNLGNWEHAVEPGGDRQRELALRLGVNIVLYSLCLDYKDDQVHAPFIMRRRAGSP